MDEEAGPAAPHEAADWNAVPDVPYPEAVDAARQLVKARQHAKRESSEMNAVPRAAEE
jgi:hypothetical protein